MKKTIKYSFLVAVIVLFSTGCKKELDNAAINHNQPTNVTPGVVLTGAETELGYVIGGDLSRFEGVFDQQVTSGQAARQFNVYTSYIFSTTDFDASWGNLYQVLLNLKTMRDQAKLSNNNVYVGVAEVLMAQTWGSLTDVYGDIPCTQALQGGAALIQPNVDKQKLVYDTIQALLSDAIIHLGAATPGNLVPSTDDVVYKGDVVKWTRLAHSLKSRYYLHLRKVDPSKVSLAVSEAALGLSANTDDAYVNYVSSASNASPWAQFSQQRGGELSFLAGSTPVMSTLMDTMYMTNDPRINGYIDTATSHNQYDQPQPFFGNLLNNSGSVAIMTYAEQLFINAELDFIQGNSAQAATDYNAAVSASVSAFGVGSTSVFLTAYANETSSSVSLNKIMTQKWVALFLNPEAFTDWRRTGYPSLSPNPGTSSAIPRRFYYSQKEISGNPSVSAISGSIQLVNRVWWDVQ